MKSTLPTPNLYMTIARKQMSKLDDILDSGELERMSLEDSQKRQIKLLMRELNVEAHTDATQAEAIDKFIKLVEEL
jgi:hypothetical protein